MFGMVIGLILQLIIAAVTLAVRIVIGIAYVLGAILGGLLGGLLRAWQRPRSPRVPLRAPETIHEGEILPPPPRPSSEPRFTPRPLRPRSRR